MMTLEIAEKCVAGARRHAQQTGMAMSIVVVDFGGRPVAMVRMDGAAWATAAVALSKAFTSAAFRMPTAQLAAMLQDNPQITSNLTEAAGDTVTLAGGGTPLFIENEHVGAIGVSGGPEAQDIACAHAGLAAINIPYAA